MSITAANTVPAVCYDIHWHGTRVEVPICKREDGSIGPPLEVEVDGAMLVLDGFADGVAGYRVK